MTLETRSAALRLTFNVDRQIEEAFSALIHEPWSRGRVDRPWLPAVDVIETDDAYLIEADLPGMAPQDVELRMEGNRVTIRGTRSGTHWTHTGRTLRMERSRGELRRSIEFEHPIDVERIEVRFENGLLRATLPKRTVRHRSAT